MSWICSECRHGNHPECKGTVGGDTCQCPHPAEVVSRATFLYINFERPYREREYFSSSALDLRMCMEADMVVECSSGRFSILKDRDGAGSFEFPVPVPLKEKGS